MLGVPRADLPRLHEWSVHWLRLKQPGATLEQQLEWARSTVELQRYFMALLDERERSPGDDLTSALLAAAAQIEPPLAREAVMGVPLDLVVAGHVTVTRAIGNALVVILGEHGRAEELRADPSLIPAAAEEILRLESPAQGLYRTTTRRSPSATPRSPPEHGSWSTTAPRTATSGCSPALPTTTLGARGSTGTSPSARASILHRRPARAPRARDRSQTPPGAAPRPAAGRRRARLGADLLRPRPGAPRRVSWEVL